MNQTENDRMIALMEHAVEHLAEHAEITLQDCEQILNDGKQNKNDMYLGFAHYYSGEAYYTLNNVEKVLYHISHAIGYLERANAWELVARAYNLTGITSIAIGNAAFAMNYYVQALACCRREGLSELENTVCINIGMLYYSYGEYEKARSYFTESLDYLTDHPETENHDQCVAVDHIGLGRCALHTGDLALAQEREQRSRIEAQNQKLTEKSETDALTGLPNRFRLNRHSIQQFAQAVTNHLPVAVEILDIDYFKQYNDNYGHQKGDRCICTIAEELKRISAYEGVSAYRYGGDEFVVLYMNLEQQRVWEIAEELRGRISMLHVEHIYSKSSDIVSISQGICWGYPTKGQRMADYLHAADDALYEVKKSERGNISLTVCSDAG